MNNNVRKKTRFLEVIFNHVLLTYKRCAFVEISLKPKLESSVVCEKVKKGIKVRAKQLQRESRLSFEYWWNVRQIVNVYFKNYFNHNYISYDFKGGEVSNILFDCLRSNH